MKTIFILLLCLCTFVQGTDYSWTVGNHRNIVGVNAKERTISVYIPSAYDGQKKLPVLWLFSPSGNPGLAYNKWADNRGVIMIAVNSSRNGPSQNNIEAQEEAIKTIDAMGLSYNSTLFMAQGMSGAAQSSWLFAIRRPK